MRVRVLGVVICGLVLAACGIPDSSAPEPIPPGRVKFDLLTPSTSEPPTTLPVTTAAATVYLIGPSRLVPVTRTVAAPVRLGTVLAALVQGPTEAEVASGLMSSVGQQARVLNSQTTNGIALINLDEAFLQLGLQAQIRALAQLVYTATSIPDVIAVQVSLNNNRGDVPRGDGTLTSEPVRRDDYATLAPL